MTTPLTWGKRLFWRGWILSEMNKKPTWAVAFSKHVWPPRIRTSWVVVYEAANFILSLPERIRGKPKKKKATG